MKNFSTIIIRKIRNFRSQKRTPLYRFKVGMSLNHGVLLSFVSLVALQTCLATFQAKNNV